MTNNSLTTEQNTMTFSARGSGFAIMPTSYKEVEILSARLAKSPIIPKAYQNQPESIFTAILMGMNHGLDPMTSLQTIDVVNGTPAMRTSMMRALVMRSGICEILETDAIIENGKYIGHTCTVKRKGQKEHTVKFTLAMADMADLRGKDNWKKYPARMCEHRAVSYALKDVFSDVLFGMVAVEEAQDHSTSSNVMREVNPLDPEQTLMNAWDAEDKKKIDVEVEAMDLEEIEIEGDILGEE